MKIVYSPKCLEYIDLASPETPGRISYCVELLKKSGYQFIEPDLAQEEDIKLVHSQDLIEKVKNEIKIDTNDTDVKNIYTYSMLAAGGAIKACEIPLQTGETALSLMRPPGHHAGKDFNGGFCYFNNIAIAVAKNLKNMKKVAILDIDCHHGNGTEDIFFRNTKVIYVSLHQAHLYTDTGLSSKFNCYNYPMEPKTSEEVYLQNLDIAIRNIYDFTPELLAVSLGFDTYKNDPLGEIKLEIESYKKIGQKIKALKLTTFIVLEGGYNTADMPMCLQSFLEGME
ncbi:MAG: histone deacetylase [Patescibacteria group bacterium]